MKIRDLKNLVDKRIFYTYANYMTFVISSLAVTFYVMAYQNNYEKSAWLLLLSFSTFVNFADVGFSSVLQRFFSFEISKINASKTRANKLFVFSNYIYLSLTFLLVVMLLFSYFYSYSKLVRNDPKILYMFIVHCLGLSVSFYGKKYANALIGLGHIYIVNYKNFIINLVKLFLVFFLILLNKSLLYIIIAIQIANLVIVFTNYILAKKHFLNKEKLFFIEFKSLFTEIFPTVWRGALGLFFSTGIIEFSNQLMSQSLSLEDANMYMLNLRIVLMISAFSMIYFSSLTPVYVDIRKNHTLLKFKNALIKPINVVAFIFLSLSLIYLIIVKFNYLGVLSLKSDLKFSVFLVLILFLERHHGLHMHIYSTQNKEPWYKFSLFSGALYLSLLLIVRPTNAIDAILILGFSNIVLNNWLPVKMSLNSMKYSLNEYFKNIYKVNYALFFVLISLIFWNFYEIYL